LKTGPKRNFSTVSHNTVRPRGGETSEGSRPASAQGRACGYLVETEYPMLVERLSVHTVGSSRPKTLHAPFTSWRR
jgi:hypothetical protein